MSWGTPVRGAEARAVEVFNELLGLLGRMQQDGRVEGFDVVLLTPNGDLNGYVTMKGSAAQIAALRDDEELMQVTVAGELVVDGLRYLDGYTNEGVARQMEMYQEAISRVAQRA